MCSISFDGNYFRPVHRLADGELQLHFHFGDFLNVLDDVLRHQVGHYIIGLTYMCSRIFVCGSFQRHDAVRRN